MQLANVLHFQHLDRSHPLLIIPFSGSFTTHKFETMRLHRALNIFYYRTDNQGLTSNTAGRKKGSGCGLLPQERGREGGREGGRGRESFNLYYLSHHIVNGYIYKCTFTFKSKHIMLFQCLGVVTKPGINIFVCVAYRQKVSTYLEDNTNLYVKGRRGILYITTYEGILQRFHC